MAVVQSGSFVAAAEKLHLTPAAISKQVKSLEESLAVELIKRDTRNLSLSEIGLQYFEQAKKILDQLQESERFIRQTRREPMGRLKIVSSRYFAEQRILPKLPTFLARYPKLKIQLELAERFPDLLREEVDILFGVSIDTYPDWVRKPLQHTRYIFCASPAYLEHFGTPTRPEDLKTHRYITHSMREQPQFIKFAHHPDVYVEPFLWLNDSAAMRECALGGLGIVALHAYFVEEDIRTGHLVEIYPGYAFAEQAVYLYYRKGHYADPKIKAFIDVYGATL